MEKPELLIDCRCECGEGPYWDVARQVLLWLDIPNGRLFEYSPEIGSHRLLFEGDPIGGFTLHTNGDLLLFEVDRISVWNRTRGRRILIEGIDADMARFNDVIADPMGRVFAGTIGKGEGQGGLYRIDRDGRVTCLFKETRIANGMAFSEDARFFYYTCTTSRRIFRFDYQPETGDLSNRTALVQVSPEEGFPDGLTMDAEGCLWSARWDGACVARLSPEGEVLVRIALPVEQVSSICFGGPNLSTLFITTAGGSPEDDSGRGGLYQFRPGVRGRVEHRSEIDVERLGGGSK